MSHKCFFLLLCSFVISMATSVSMTMAQTTTKTLKKTNEEDIFDALAKKNSWQGKVVVNQDPKMSVLLDKKIAENEDKQYITFLGYRVQVYMGNNQKKSKTEALEREKKILEKYPELTSYLSFASPFWKLRVGDFRTHTDALVLCKQLLAAFPEMSGEIYIVRDDETRDLTLEKAK